MYFTIYKITNKLDGKTYIGKHQTQDLDDGYMGSGKLLKRAIKKYGIENFTKEILFNFTTEEEMNAKEKELVVLGENSYNLCEGGHGGFGYINRVSTSEQKAAIGAKGGSVRWTDERKAAQSVRLCKEYKDGHRSSWFKNNDVWTGRKHSEETKRKISEAAKARIARSKCEV